MNDELNDELNALTQEIKDAHDKLTSLGAGKPHWSLAGRIEMLVIQLIMACTTNDEASTEFIANMLKKNPSIVVWLREHGTESQ